MNDEFGATLTSHLPCNVCGETESYLYDGYFYCQECGTKQDHIREVEIDQEDDINEPKYTKKIKIQSSKGDTCTLTSWECYNYILRGLVDDLLSLGAKEDLKLMTLQIWAAYLRYLEVAFINKKHADLPKLGLHYYRGDAKVLYNHHAEKRRSRKKQSQSGASSLDTSARDYRRTKRKLDESLYTNHSASMLSGAGSSSLNLSGSTSVSSLKSIKLSFSSKARKILKKKMSTKHLYKHEMDGKSYDFQKTIPKKNFSKNEIDVINFKQIYTILAIALNLIGDDIQLCDLVRYTSEGRLRIQNILSYFPENIAENAKTILKELKFCQNMYIPEKSLRLNVGLFAKYLKIRQFKSPDIYQLASRYIIDLNLPEELTIYVGRLINFLPPKVKNRSLYTYPHYEARAMAYVVFILKLLFGLDGNKDRIISNASKKINKQLKIINKESILQKELFVLEEWVEYIEMRKVIISQYNSNFCRQFNQSHNIIQLLEKNNEEQQNEYQTDKPTPLNSKIWNMKVILEKLFLNDKNCGYNSEKQILFQSTLTPGHSYLKRILLNFPKLKENSGIVIPEYMRIEHTQRTLQPYLEPKSLQTLFLKHNYKMLLSRIASTNESSFIGIMRMPRKTNFKKLEKADFDVTTESWQNSIKYVVDDILKLNQDFDFNNTCLDSTKTRNLKLIKPKNQSQNLIKIETRHIKKLKISNNLETLTNVNSNIQSMLSIDVFDENNMDPIDGINISEPRRHLNEVNLFKDLCDQEVDNSILDSSTCIDGSRQKTIKLAISNMDYWILAGHWHIQHFTEVQRKILKDKLPHSFFWLLETCAQTIGVDWVVLYDQLLVIEVMFGFGTENLENFQNCLYLRNNFPIKDIDLLVKSFRPIW